MNRKHGANCRPNRISVPRKIRTNDLPCGIPKQQMSKCWESRCYLNYKCPIYKGKRVNPPMDFIPLDVHGHPYRPTASPYDGTELWFQHLMDLSVV